jgi:hypothetical protein
MAAANVALLVAAVPVVGHLADATAAPGVIEVPIPLPVTAGLVNGGLPVDNIYPYSRDGRLLHDVLLFDGAGLPLDVRPGVPDASRRVLLDAFGNLIFNAFPVRYYEPGTAIVAHPDAGPRVTIPRLATPPVRRSGSTP